MSDEPVLPTPREKLAKHNDDVVTRLKEVIAMFPEDKYNPWSHIASFQKTVMEHLSAVNAWYVLNGTFIDPSAPVAKDPIQQKEEAMRALGFNINVDDPKFKALDPALQTNPAALAAFEAGVDLDSDPDYQTTEL